VSSLVSDGAVAAKVRSVSSRIAVLGLGEAGGRLAADLAAAGADVHGYDPVAVSTPEGVARAASAEEAVSGSAVVLGLTTARTARDALDAVLPALLDVALYADLNTGPPQLKRELAERVEAAGAAFADVALLGPIPTRGLGAPALASGAGAQAFADALAPYGMPVRVVSAVPGDAAAMKLVRSVFMKGLAACAIESLRAADAAGCREWLEAELAAVIGEELLERLVEGSRVHAARRVEEMEAASALLRDLRIEPRIADASGAALAALAEGRER